MKRQAISLNMEDILRLLEECKLIIRDRIITDLDPKQKVQFNIINKTPKCSDTWEFEKWYNVRNVKDG